MKRNVPFQPASRLLKATVAMILGATPLLVAAATTDLAPSPISSGSSGVVKPNVSFVLDSSGSMDRNYAPDEASPFTSKYGFKSSQCNSIYYNPAINYVPPKTWDGLDFPLATYTNAYDDGYDTGSPRANLSTNFKAHSGDTGQQAYYYKYTGTATANFLNTTNLFYRQCNSSIGSAPGNGVFTLQRVTTTSGPLATDERQNFANWYTYYRTRMLMMKSAAGRAFSTIGTSYRIGFMTIYTTPNNSLTDPGYLRIAPFDATQKQTWYQKFYAQQPGGNTPLKAALSAAGRNFAGVLGPDPIEYSCQQNFAILTTDGYWNNGTPNGVKLNGSSTIGNQDNVLSASPRPMYDGNLSGASNTLADVAKYYYETDLRPTGGGCMTGVGPSDVCIDNVPVSGLDDNPKQHMTTFTVGLGVNGLLGYDDAYLTGGSADFNAIKGGSKNWPVPVGDELTTIDDLWHAAVNGRGQYFSAKNPDKLVTGLRAALAGVSAREAAGAAAATSNLEPVAGDNFAYVANYRTQKWDGDVQARLIDVVTGKISDTPVWSAVTGPVGLDSRVMALTDDRTIFTFLGGVKKDFVPATFSAAEKASWFTPDTVPALTQSAGWSVAQKAEATPDSLINYLRGRFQNEERAVAPKDALYRTREHVLGDVVNGKPVYVKVPPFNYSENNYQLGFKGPMTGRAGAVYVAANDGMLHSFDSVTGRENWAYIPSFVLPNLKTLADSSYATMHRFYTDGSPTVSDVYTGSAWRTILVAGLNAGGKGYYALDVTDPVAPSVLWEFSHAQLGFTYGNPVVGKLKDGKWYVFLTTGYNNADGMGRLFVLDAYTGVLRYTLDTNVGAAATPSGLAKISAWVDDGLNDNTVQRLYGGDTLGNLWRFDVNDIIAPPGREATLFAILKEGVYLQPITTKPELGLVQNKPVVYVGTGKYLGASDVTDVGQQSLYALRDDLTATGWGNVRAQGSTMYPAPASCSWVKQSLTTLTATTRSTSSLPVDLAGNCGWYLDFNPAGASPGERMNVDPKLQLGVLVLATNIPETSICTVGGTSWIYFFDYAKGTFVSTSTGSVVGQQIGSSIAVGLNTYRLPDGRVVTTVTTSDDQHPVFGNPDNPLIGAIGKRVLWRELLQ